MRSAVNKAMPLSYLCAEVRQVLSMVRTLEHEQHPDLMGRAREGRTRDSAAEEYEVCVGGIVLLAGQRALVDRTAVLNEARLTRLHAAVQTVR